MVEKEEEAQEEFFVSVSSLDEEGFDTLWEAIADIFESPLTPTQAKVVGKTFAGESLTSSERNTRQQFRKKLRKMKPFWEIWEDMEFFLKGR